VTCIVGIEHDGGVTIGADAAGSTSDITVARADVKLFDVGPYMFGFTSSFRMGQLLQHSFNPTVPDLDYLDRFMVTTFVDELRSCFDDGGFSKHTNGVERGGTFLVAVAGRLFCIEGDYQVGRHLDGYAACGSGELLAMGSLHTTAQFDFAPRVRAQLALEAAARHNPFVGGPFLIKTQKS
jgi:ATP-dependent protease HslVU (ClpYQ) peptidase subunit